MKLILSTLLIIITGALYAQTADTIVKVKSERLPDKFPAKRNFELKYEQFAAGNFTPELDGQKKGNWKFSNHFRFKAGVMVPVYADKKWLVNASAAYKYEVFEFNNFRNPTGSVPPIMQGKKEDYNLFTGSMSVRRVSTLLGKRMVYNGILLADASDKEFGLIKGSLSATMILSRTSSSSFAVVLVSVIDPSAGLPFIPIPLISYQRDFQNTWSLDFVLPQRVFIRKGVFKNGRISLGSELEKELLYVQMNTEGRKTTYDYRQMELKSGIIYEHNLGYNIIATVKGGLTNYVYDRGTIKGGKAKNYVFKAEPDAIGYFSVGISFKPFEK